MRMWSRGLGRMNIGIDATDMEMKTFKEAIDFMPEPSRAPLLDEIETRKCIVLSGKMMPPVGWEFTIFFSKRDLFLMAFKMLFSIKIFGLFFQKKNKGSEVLFREPEQAKM